MGAGTIIATAIVIILLIITGYILIGGILSTARIVVMAQHDVAEQDAERMHTQIEIDSTSTNTSSHETFIELKNTGSEVVGNFNHMEVFLLQDETPYMYMNQSGQYNWTYRIEPPDTVNPGLLDPDEVMNVTVPYNSSCGDPTRVQVTTANGVSAFKNVV